MPRVDVRPNGCWPAWACRSAPTMLISPSFLMPSRDRTFNIARVPHRVKQSRICGSTTPAVPWTAHRAGRRPTDSSVAVGALASGLHPVADRQARGHGPLGTADEAVGSGLTAGRGAGAERHGLTAPPQAVGEHSRAGPPAQQHGEKLDYPRNGFGAPAWGVALLCTCLFPTREGHNRPAARNTRAAVSPATAGLCAPRLATSELSTTGILSATLPRSLRPLLIPLASTAALKRTFFSNRPRHRLSSPSPAARAGPGVASHPRMPSRKPDKHRLATRPGATDTQSSGGYPSRIK
jgi:hypothetical protein